MKEKAIAKMSAECEKLKNEGEYEALVAIEEHYTEKMTDAVAEKILAEDKTLQGALQEIFEYASANRKSGAKCVCVAPWEAWNITDDYFDIAKEDWEQEKKPEKKSDSTELDIFDFM